MTEFEIRKLWAVSTGHLREVTCNEWLGSMDRPRLPVAYPKGDYGWFVFVPDDDRGHSTPNELKVIFAVAREQGIDWIEFDADAPVVDGLTLFDW